MIIIISGVSGVGKTTVGKLLANDLGCEFFDADDFHSSANVAKMSAGKPLDDEDRREWLERLVRLVADLLSVEGSAVLACSALKKAYRDQLCIGTAVKLVLLQADFSTISERLSERPNHFMNSNLLESQFETLEPVDSEDLVIDATMSPDAIVKNIMTFHF